MVRGSWWGHGAPVAAVGAVVGATVLFGAGSVGAQATPCEREDAVLATGQLAAAKPLYEALVAEDPELQCATDALEAIRDLQDEAHGSC